MTTQEAKNRIRALEAKSEALLRLMDLAGDLIDEHDSDDVRAVAVREVYDDLNAQFNSVERHLKLLVH